MHATRKLNRRLIAMAPLVVGLSFLLLVGALGETKDSAPAIDPETPAAADSEPSGNPSETRRPARPKLRQPPGVLCATLAPVEGASEHPSQEPPAERPKLQQPAGALCAALAPIAVASENPSQDPPAERPKLQQPVGALCATLAPIAVASENPSQDPPAERPKLQQPAGALCATLAPIAGGSAYPPQDSPAARPKLQQPTGALCAALAPIAGASAYPPQDGPLARPRLEQPTAVWCTFADQPSDPASGHDAKEQPGVNATEASPMDETKGPMGSQPLPFGPMESELPTSPSEPFSSQLEPLPPISEEIWTESPEAGVPGAAGQAEAPEKLGEAPKEEPKRELQFLRRDSVLLDPGEYQFDLTLEYLVDESDTVYAEIEGSTLRIGELRRRHRLLMLPLEFRLGIWEDTQAFINVPVGWSNSELAFLGTDEVANAGGIGDISAGITRLLLERDDVFPDVLGTIAFSAPTGQSSIITSLSTPGSSLGEGFWTATVDLTCIHTYDPVVVYYGLGYRHRFSNEFEGGIHVEPGNQATYRIGFGFAVNPRVTLSASFFGSYIAEDRVNGVRVPGGIREPMYLRLASTIVRDKDRSKRDGPPRTVEPFIRLGMTDEAIDSLIGISWTR